MSVLNHRAVQPGAALAQKAPPRIIAFEPIPASFVPQKPAPYRADLSEFLEAGEADELAAAGQMAFHCIGDSGGVKRPEAQMLVAQGMLASLKTEKMSPSFCYHLGDVVYYTGEVSEYLPQFYQPYEGYPLKIMGIPGNHDGEKQTEASTTLLGFYRNFVGDTDTHTQESGDTGRPVGTQPWFYWTLTTPFATFIGLYTNVPEHGQISPEQRAWFRAEMAAADPAKALIVALHHPVYSFDKYHSGSPTMAQELQDAINESRRVPNLVLAAHVHNYQRIELATEAGTIPFMVIGNGGYWNLHYLASPPGFQDPDTGAKLMAAIDSRHGFMTFSISPKVINGHFTTVPRPHESWSDPNAFNPTFDVFSYPATPLFLQPGASVTLVPGDGANIAPLVDGPPHGPASHAHPMLTAAAMPPSPKGAALQAHALRTARRLEGRQT